jgi:alpha-glucosidase
MKNFSRMKFRTVGVNTLGASLSGGVRGHGTLITPWRFVMCGSSPAEILGNNYLVPNLAEPLAIEDPSWIRPGKVIREITLTTRGGMACVDFAAEYGLQFIEFDAGWYGHEYDNTSDATTVTVDPKRSPGPLDLQAVIDYGRSKDIGVILYVNRRALETQLDEILPLFRSWGVAGVKYGFVNVGPQNWTQWLHEAVRKAAAHELMVDVHDEYRPTGFSRSYPNMMTVEGVGGDETAPPNEMVINTLFTRMIAGEADHTNCYFTERVPTRMGSHASQLAKTVCIYSPWQFLFWYDRPPESPGAKEPTGSLNAQIEEVAELDFFRQVPTVWDETRILDGYPGSHAVVARRSGEHWFVGALNGTGDRDFSIPLGFLEAGRNYTVQLYSDDASLGTLTDVRLETFQATSETRLERRILRRNGLAMILTPQ